MDNDRDELTKLIEQALGLADERQLNLVSIKLEEARIAMIAEPGPSGTLARLEDIVRALPIPVRLRSVSGGNVVTLHAPTSVEHLLSDHAALDARRKALLALVEGPPTAAEAERQLNDFGLLIEAHRATERRCVYGPLLARGVDADLTLERSLTSLVGEMETDWDSYLHQWDRDRIENNWFDFAVATHFILARAAERMRLEEKVIYPVCFLSGLIRLRESAG